MKIILTPADLRAAVAEYLSKRAPYGQADVVFYTDDPAKEHAYRVAAHAVVTYVEKDSK